MVAFTVIPEIEPENIVAVLVQDFRGPQNIGGIRTALPAVQQDHQAFCRPAYPGRMKTKQPGTIISFNNHLPGGIAHYIFAARTKFNACQDRLNMGRAQKNWRATGIRGQHW